MEYYQLTATATTTSTATAAAAAADTTTTAAGTDKRHPRSGGVASHLPLCESNPAKGIGCDSVSY